MAPPIYRIPPYVLGPNILTAADIAERRPWSIVKQNVEPLWADTMGEGILVSIIDTGLWTHRDLPKPEFAHNFSRSRDVYDYQGHGTHVAGTVGARLDNKDLVGYAPKCSMGCCKALGDDGSGTSVSIANAIYKSIREGAHIINMSLGGAYDQRIEEACLAAIEAGIFVICAAGNEGMSGLGFPAKLPSTGAVASFDKNGQISRFSSRGPEVDIAFPGEDILSTWLDNNFREISGTSMACPAACGLTALMLAYQRKNPEVLQIKTMAQLKQRWQESAIDVGQPGKDNSFGWGIPDADGYVRGPKQTVTPTPTPISSELYLGSLTIQAMQIEGKDGLFISSD